MKLIQNPCRNWLPEFDTDHECCEGRVIDIDTYMEQGFTDIFYSPCPICNAAEFEKHLAELRQDDGAEEAERLFKAAERAKWRINMQQKGRRE